jgi:MFS family permease
MQANNPSMGASSTDAVAGEEVAEPAQHSSSRVEADPPWPRRIRGWYVAAVLTALYTLSFIDRQVLGLVLEPIRGHLGLTDTQVSLLAGSAFALFYVTLGLPLGRLADRANRRNLILAGVFLWSLMTAACGLASSFWQLFAARVGVGIGEAALSPAALSIISDYFPPEKRARPLAMYTLALAIGSGLAYLVGGSISAAIATMPHFRIPLIGHADRLSFPRPARLHHSLAIVAAIVLPLSTVLAWWGLPHLGRSIAAAQLWMGNSSPGSRSR